MTEDLQQLQSLYNLIVEFAVTYSFQLIGALIIFAIGFWMSNKVGKLIEGLMRSRSIDVTLSRFTGSAMRIVVLVMVLVIVLGKLGISVSPFIAAIGALGLGAGLALQGMLANYAAGFTIIITRPFVVGDTIRVQEVTGLVDEVHLGFTILLDEDGVRIQIPNRLIVGEILHNSSGQMLIELQVGIAYDADTRTAIIAIEQGLAEMDGLDPERSPLVGIDNFGESSINIGVRFRAPTARHYELRYAANKIIEDALASAGIGIPFPQREIRILGENRAL